jgi:hypothetical protein
MDFNFLEDKDMKKFYNLLSGALLSALVIAGSVFTSCEQLTEISAGSDASAKFLTLNSVNAPFPPTSWTQVTGYTPNGGGGHCVYGNVNGTGIFLSANWNNGNVGYSTDGTNWSSYSTTFGNSYIKHLAFIDDEFWAVGQGGTISTSTNGQAWTPVSSGGVITGDIYGVAYDGGDTFVFVTDIRSASPYTSQIVVYNELKSTWTEVTNPVERYKIDSVVYSQGKFIIVCNGGFISYTTDSSYENWAAPFQIETSLGFYNTNHFKMAAVGEADDGTGTVRPAVVAVSRYGLGYVFTDGSIDEADWGWVEIYSSTSTTKLWLNCVLFDGEKFVVAGEDGGMAYSNPTNLAVWNIDTNFTWTDSIFKGAYINGLAFDSDNSVYLATGGDSSPLAAIAVEPTD